MNFHIRYATETDLDALCYIEVSATALYERAGFSPVEASPRSYENLAHLLQNTHVLVAEDEQKVVMGYISFCHYDPYLHIEEFSVAEPFQGQGVGTALLATFLESGDDDCLGFTLTAYREATWAISLYRRTGFREIEDVSEVSFPEVLASIVERDREAGLNVDKRCMMIKTR